MSSKSSAGGFGSRYTSSASVPISSFQSAPRTRFSSPAASKRPIASRRSACGRSYSFQKPAFSVCPTERILPGLVRHVGDRVVAIDERPVEEAVLHAAGLVLDLEQLPAVLRIDDPLEAPLGFVGLHRDQAARSEE